MHTLSIKNLHIRIELLISWFEWSLLVLAVALYIYFIAASVIQVVLRQELLVSIQEAETQVSTLEATYIVGSSRLSRAAAEELGLVNLETASYVAVTQDDRLTRSE